MSRYSEYKHLLGRKYVAGKDDCYGLIRAYYKDVLGVELKNFARPAGFYKHKDLDIINNLIFVDKWKSRSLSVRMLQIGDALIYSIGDRSGIANHLGVYVGNGMFVHHMIDRPSVEEPLMDKWTSRLLAVVRHPEVKIEVTKINATDILSPYAQRTLRNSP